MKKWIYTAAAVLALAAWQSCDKVDFPIQSNGGPTGPTGPTHVVERRVLLEDYTGTSCGTCPPAGVEAENIEANYGTKVVALTVHAGFLAIPSSPPLDYDFRNPIATDYYNTFGIQSNPTGMVNRVGFPTSTHLLSYSGWDAAVASAIALPQDVDIEIQNNFNTSTRVLNVTVTTRYLNNLSGFYKLAVLFKEDSVQKPQKDDAMPPPSIDMNYYHRNVLRGAINGNSTGWGDTLVVGNALAGDSVVKNYTFTVPSTYGNWTVNDNRCYVVAFVYDAEGTSSTHYEVIQAEEKRIR
jgi:hypothetical protein